MTDDELLEIEEILEHPDLIDDLSESSFHQLADVYHRGQMAKITKKILEDLSTHHDFSADAIKAHKDYPLYRHHADEAVRHHNACQTEEVNEEIVEMPDGKEKFSKQMSPRLDDVLRSASKALAGKLLSPEEQLRGTFDEDCNRFDEGYGDSRYNGAAILPAGDVLYGKRSLTPHEIARGDYDEGTIEHYKKDNGKIAHVFTSGHTEHPNIGMHRHFAHDQSRAYLFHGVKVGETHVRAGAVAEHNGEDHTNTKGALYTYK